MKGVLFDFNGTLVFDSALHEKAWQIFLNWKKGLPSRARGAYAWQAQPNDIGIFFEKNHITL